MEVTKEEFDYWKKDPVTKEVFLALEKARDRIEEQMLDDNTLLCDQALRKLSELSGVRQGINLILNIDYEE